MTSTQGGGVWSPDNNLVVGNNVKVEQRSASSDSGMSCDDNSPRPSSNQSDTDNHHVVNVTDHSKLLGNDCKRRRPEDLDAQNSSEQASTPLDFSMKRAAPLSVSHRSHSVGDTGHHGHHDAQHPLLCSLLPQGMVTPSFASAFHFVAQQHQQQQQQQNSQKLPGPNQNGSAAHHLLPPHQTPAQMMNPFLLSSLSLPPAMLQPAHREPPVVMNTPNNTHLNQKAAPQAKHTPNPHRPFKVYNPADPLSALQVTNGGTNSLKQQINQMGLLKSTNNQITSTTPTKKMNASTPSPPQVTSTSHPHTEGHLSTSSPTSAKTLPICAQQPVVRASATSVIVDNHHKAAAHLSGSAAPEQHHQLMSPAAPSETSTTSGMSRSRGKSVPDDAKDDTYWERRRKNNEAAKRSRDTRRTKEDEIAMKAALLEQENLRLRIEVAQLRAETEKLRQMLVNV